MIKKESPLKPRIQQSVGKLSETISKIDYIHTKLQEKDEGYSKELSNLSKDMTELQVKFLQMRL